MDVVVHGVCDGVFVCAVWSNNAGLTPPVPNLSHSLRACLGRFCRPRAGTTSALYVPPRYNATQMDSRNSYDPGHIIRVI